MSVKRFGSYVAIALLAFLVGTIAATLWKSRDSRSQNSHSQESGLQASRSQAPAVNAQDVEPEWPLTKQIISRSLQTHSFRTDKLLRNSDDEIVWRWLKESIAGYPQNWVKLNIVDGESCGVVLYPPKVLESIELNYLNRRLNEKGLPLLIEGKRYLPINVYQGDIICPNWSGFIDVEEAKLVYFVGESA